MKKLFYLSFIVLLSSCSSKNEDSIITVSFPAEGTEFISWFDRFPDMEMICLTGENLPMLTFFSDLVVHDNMYYVIDKVHTQQVHSFDQDGKYFSSVGSFGRGPNEYLDIADVLIDDNGNISIFSQKVNTLFTHSPDGVLLEKRKLPYPTERFISHNGLNYHYIGIASKLDYLLYVTNDNGEVVGEYLPTPLAPTLGSLHRFSIDGDKLLLCPTEGNDIYLLQDGKIETKYRFDFGEYNIPEEYYECANLASMLAVLEGRSIVYKNDLGENRDCFVLMLGHFKNLDMTNFYGVWDKRKDQWKWYNHSEDDFVFFKCFDDEYAYFTADPAAMKEIPELVNRFPSLNTLTDEDGVVIIKAKTKRITL